MSLANNTALLEAILHMKAVGFMIDDDILAAEEGMTWGEWCDTSYNTIGAYTMEEGWLNVGDSGMICMGANVQSVNDVIIHGQIYDLDTMGGPV